jgi:hypothetical protein
MLVNKDVVYSTECQQQIFQGFFARDIYYNNGNEFFIYNNKINIILWKYINQKDWSMDSILLTADVGKNHWIQRTINGRAYYLGDGQICSINKTTGKADLYTIDGNRILSISYDYKKHKNEIHLDQVIPIKCPDGSIILFARYCYDERNPLLSAVLNIFTFGHGQKPRCATDIIIEPLLLKDNTKTAKEICYIKQTEIDKITVYGCNLKSIDNLNDYTIKILDYKEFKVYELNKKNTTRGFDKRRDSESYKEQTININGVIYFANWYDNKVKIDMCHDCHLQH